MKHFKKSLALLLLIIVCIGPAMAQPNFSLNALPDRNRAKEVQQDNEYVIQGRANGIFLCNPLVLNGQPLDYNTFSLQSKGELTLIKENAIIGQLQIPFYVSIRRNGTLIKLPGDEMSKSKHEKIEISTILKLAKPGDQLIIEPVNAGDWQAKRILKLLEEDRC